MTHAIKNLKIVLCILSKEIHNNNITKKTRLSVVFIECSSKCLLQMHRREFALYKHFSLKKNIPKIDQDLMRQAKISNSLKIEWASVLLLALQN